VVGGHRAPNAAKETERAELMDDHRRVREQVTSRNVAFHDDASGPGQLHRVCHERRVGSCPINSVNK
jgi:hypothetical protein